MALLEAGPRLAVAAVLEKGALLREAHFLTEARILCEAVAMAGLAPLFRQSLGSAPLGRIRLWGLPHEACPAGAQAAVEGAFPFPLRSTPLCREAASFGGPWLWGCLPLRLPSFEAAWLDM
jgi:hypothetical protein